MQDKIEAVQERGVMLDQPHQIAAYFLLAQRAALKLEILGMKHSGGSVYAYIKRYHGFKGGKQRVLEHFEEKLRETGVLKT